MLAGLGALAAAPMAAAAETVTRIGHRADGAEWDGLVTVEGKTYLYRGGSMSMDGETEHKGKQMYFSPEDGHMAQNEDVKWKDGTRHHYGEDGVLNDRPVMRKVAEKDLPAGWYNLKLAAGDYRLDIAGAKAGDDETAYLQAPDDGRGIEQKFLITWPDPSRVKVESPMGVLRVRGASKDDGAEVTQCPEAGEEMERWTPERSDDGHYLFRNAVNGGVLSVDKAGSAEKARCLADDGADTQRWELASCGGFTGWWSDADGKTHCTDPSSALMIRSAKREDPYRDDFGSIYDFDAHGVASWHLPTYEDVPGGHGEDAPVPSPRGDRRQRVLALAISRIGCPYELGAIPRRFVCDGLSGWCYETATGDSSYSGDASCQWQMVKDRNGIKSGWDDLVPGDLVFFGNPQVTYGPGSIDYNGEAYHAGIYYSGGQMINARNSGTQITGVDWYDANMMKWLGGGSPYQGETSMVAIPR